MECLFCGKTVGPLRELIDSDFCCEAHRKRYHQVVKRNLDSVLQFEVPHSTSSILSRALNATAVQELAAPAEISDYSFELIPSTGMLASKIADLSMLYSAELFMPHCPPGGPDPARPSHRTPFFTTSDLPAAGPACAGRLTVLSEAVCSRAAPVRPALWKPAGYREPLVRSTPRDESSPLARSGTPSHSTRVTRGKWHARPLSPGLDGTVCEIAPLAAAALETMLLSGGWSAPLPKPAFYTTFRPVLEKERSMPGISVPVAANSSPQGAGFRAYDIAEAASRPSRSTLPAFRPVDLATSCAFPAISPNPPGEEPSTVLTGLVGICPGPVWGDSSPCNQTVPLSEANGRRIPDVPLRFRHGSNPLVPCRADLPHDAAARRYAGVSAAPPRTAQRSGKATLLNASTPAVLPPAGLRSLPALVAARDFLSGNGPVPYTAEAASEAAVVNLAPIAFSRALLNIPALTLESSAQANPGGQACTGPETIAPAPGRATGAAILDSPMPAGSGPGSPLALAFPFLVDHGFVVFPGATAALGYAPPTPRALAYWEELPIAGKSGLSSRWSSVNVPEYRLPSPNGLVLRNGTAAAAVRSGTPSELPFSAQAPIARTASIGVPVLVARPEYPSMAATPDRKERLSAELGPLRPDLAGIVPGGTATCDARALASGPLRTRALIHEVKSAPAWTGLPPAAGVSALTVKTAELPATPNNVPSTACFAEAKPCILTIGATQAVHSLPHASNPAAAGAQTAPARGTTSAFHSVAVLPGYQCLALPAVLPAGNQPAPPLRHQHVVPELRMRRATAPGAVFPMEAGSVPVFSAPLPRISRSMWLKPAFASFAALGNPRVRKLIEVSEYKTQPCYPDPVPEIVTDQIVVSAWSAWWNRLPSQVRGMTRAAAAVLVLVTGWRALSWTGVPAHVASMRETIAQCAQVQLASRFEEPAREFDGRVSTWSVSPDGFTRPGALALYRPSMKLVDYRLEFTTQIDRRGIGVAFRASDTSNYAAAKITFADGGPRPPVVVSHYTVRDGRATRGAPVPLRGILHRNQPFLVQLDARGATFTLSIDGQVADSWTDSRFRSGGVGFFSDGGDRARLYSLKLSANTDLLGSLCASFVPSRNK
jgi:hypothetical protein